MVIKVEEDDHGHATLLVHGEPEIVQLLAATVTMLLAADADAVLTPEEFEELTEGDESEEDLASSS